jgi:pimeloyl-ACP methyl ester carboxylesterase
MTCVVLVHGAWGGAWIWRRVIGPLRAAGHEVHAVTLTGDGERAHLRRRDITLQTHLEDVLGLIEAEELREVVLVGHSYGGMVITGAADALLARGAVTVKHLVYVDAMVPLPRLFLDCNRPAYPTIDAMRQRVREQPGWRVVEIATGHCPMVSTPQVLAQHLLSVA